MTWDELTDAEKVNLQKQIRFWTRWIHDRDDAMQHCWCGLLEAMETYDRTLCHNNGFRWFEYRIRAALYWWCHNDAKHGFTFRSGNRRGRKPDIPEQGTKRHPKPGGEKQGIDSLDFALPRNEGRRRSVKENREFCPGTNR